MASLFSSPKTPKVTPATQATPEVVAAADAERRRQQAGAGRAATMLSGGTGAATPTVGTKTLLGQ